MLNLAFSMVLFSVLGKFGAVTGGTDGLRFDRPSLPASTLNARLRDRPARTRPRNRGPRRLAVQYYFRTVDGQALARIKHQRDAGWSTWAYRPSACSGAVTRSRPALCGLGGSIFALTQGLVTPIMWVLGGARARSSSSPVLGGLGARHRSVHPARSCSAS